MENEIRKICKRIDKNFDDLKKDVELTEDAKNRLTPEEIEKIEKYIRKQKLISDLDDKIAELEKEL